MRSSKVTICVTHLQTHSPRDTWRAGWSGVTLETEQDTKLQKITKAKFCTNSVSSILI